MSDATIKLAEHLRLVHFTLVVVSLTLLIGMLDYDEGVQEELNSVVNLIDAFRPDAENYRNFEAGILEKLLRESVSLRSLGKSPDGTLRISGASQNLSIDVPLYLSAPVTTVFHSESAYEWSGLQGDMRAHYSDFLGPYRSGYFPIEQGIPDKDQPSSSPLLAKGPWKTFERPPKSIGEFKKFWNYCAKMRDAYILVSVSEPRAFLVTADEMTGAINIRGTKSPLNNAPQFDPKNKFLISLTEEWDVLQEVTQDLKRNFVIAGPEILTVDNTFGKIGLSTFRRQLRAIVRPENPGYSWIIEFSSMKPGDVLITATAEYRHKSLNLQQRLLSLIDDNKRQRGLFERSFPEIERYLKDIDYHDNIEFGVLNALFEHEKLTSGSPLELLGLKIDRINLGFWGVAVLVIIQLYFSLHLREFTKRARTGYSALEVAWIGLYPGFISFLLFLISVVVLPITVSMLVVINKLDFSNSSCVEMILCAFSVFISSATVVRVVFLRRLVRNANLFG